MGAAISRIMGKLFGTRELRVLMLGLDNAGKTCMLPCACLADRSHPVQAQDQTERQDNSDGGLQRRNTHIQKHQVQCLGALVLSIH